MSDKNADAAIDTGIDTSVIDEKKGGADDNSDSYKSRVMVIISFLISAMLIILRFLLHFSVGALMLFLCKLAQTNIMPTEAKCAPYTDLKPEIEEIETNIFTTFSFTEPQMSMKLKIPYDKNSKYSLLNMLKEWRESSSTSYLSNYLIAITEQQLQFSYSCINSTMSSINGMLPEWLIVFFGPLIAAFMFILHNLMNSIYFIYLWFANRDWFFKVNKNASTDKKAEWVDTWSIQQIFWYSRKMASFAFIFLFPVFLFIPVLCYNYVLFSSFFYKLLLNGEQISVFKIIVETLKYYKVTIVALIVISVTLLAFSKLGIAFGVTFIVIMIMIYMGYIRIDSLNELFKPIPEKNLSPLVSSDQAHKTCSEPKKVEKRTWLGWILGYKSPEKEGQKGGRKTVIDPIKQLKELKKLQKSSL